jgi:hypothetical protein
MAVFKFPTVNMSIALSNGGLFNNHERLVVEVAEGDVADALRSARLGVYEIGSMPHESLREYIEVSNDGAVYPMPEFEGAKVVVVGRGVSSEGWRDRYDETYVVCGINPASIPISRNGDVVCDATDGFHAGDYRFDAVFSLDYYYYQQPYVKQYKGPVIGPAAHKGEYFGAGTYHSVSHLLPFDPALSFGLALATASVLGASDIILCGCDFQGSYGGLIPAADGGIRGAQERCDVWIDRDNLWKPIGIEVWNGS